MWARSKVELQEKEMSITKLPSVYTINLLSKEEYESIVQEKRAVFVHKHFRNEINELFNNLREQADKLKHCHSEIKIEVPYNFDVNKTEETLRSYFKGLGYEVIAEPRKDDTTTIVMTLT